MRIDYEKLATTTIKEQDTTQLEYLCGSACALQGNIEALEQLLIDKKKEYKELTEHKIPALMEDLGFEAGTVTLKNGQKLTLKEKVCASITKKNEEAAFKWLVENGFEGLIKNEMKINLGKGREDVTTSLATWLSEANLAFERKQAVHHSTLNAFAKERIESGDADFPWETFSVFVHKQATIK